MKFQNTARQSGFTIVELLIVVVVIGILAAITIVAYNGTQNRAKAAQYQTDATSLDKKAEIYNTVLSAYPLTVAGTDAATVVAQTATGTALTSTINTPNESRLPTNLTVFAVVPYATVPTYAQTMVAISASASARSYFVAYCAGGGMRIYYPDPTTSTVKTSDSGICP